MFDWECISFHALVWELHKVVICQNVAWHLNVKDSRHDRLVISIICWYHHFIV